MLSIIYYPPPKTRNNLFFFYVPPIRIFPSGPNPGIKSSPASGLDQGAVSPLRSASISSCSRSNMDVVCSFQARSCQRNNRRTVTKIRARRVNLSIPRKYNARENARTHLLLSLGHALAVNPGGDHLGLARDALDLHRQVPSFLVYVQIAEIQQYGLAAVDEVWRRDLRHGLLLIRGLPVDGLGRVDGRSGNLFHRPQHDAFYLLANDSIPVSRYWINSTRIIYSRSKPPWV